MDFILQLVGVSLGGGGVILLLLLLTRLTGGRYAARWRCWAWVLLGLRLALPCSLLPERTAQTAPIVLSAPENTVLYRSAPTAPAQAGLQVPAVSAPAQAIQTPGTEQVSPPPISAAEPEERKPPALSLTLGEVLLGMWGIGAVGVLGWNGAAHLRFCRYLRRWSYPADEPLLVREFNWLGDRLKLLHRPQLRLCPGLTVPMLAGVVRPVLLLPEACPPGEGRCYSLLHELTHYRRRDIWLKTLMVWVCALHWFNPLVWLMARAVARDTELACDEGALKWLSKDERAAYGRAILQAAAAGKEC